MYLNSNWPKLDVNISKKLVQNSIYIAASHTPVPFNRDKVNKAAIEHNFPFDFLSDKEYHYSFILSCNITRPEKEIASSYVLTENMTGAVPINSLVYFSKDKLIEGIIYIKTIYDLLEKDSRNILYFQYATEDCTIAQAQIEKWIINVNKLRKT